MSATPILRRMATSRIKPTHFADIQRNTLRYCALRADSNML